nr:unnamed protein product [Digitaria exilis]
MGQSQGRAARPKPNARHATEEKGQHQQHQQQHRGGDIARPGGATTGGPAMDTFFLSHGSPTLSIDEAIPARHFFKSWLPARVAGDRTPRAILMVSGHWETATPAVNVRSPFFPTSGDPLALPILLVFGNGNTLV